MTGSWLCPTELDRQRVVDMSARVRRARLLALGFVAIGAVILAPILSWWLLALLAITGGPTSPLLVNLCIPVGMMAARFRTKVVFVGALFGALTVVGVGLAVDPDELVRSPTMTVVSLVLLGSVVAIALAIQSAEIQHRSAAVLDPLTG